MITAITNISKAFEQSRHDAEAANKTEATQPSATTAAALPDDELAVLRIQGQEGLRNYQAGKAQAAAEAARIARLPQAERAVVRMLGEKGLDGYRTGQSMAEIAGQRNASLRQDERAIRDVAGEEGLRSYQTGRSQGALRADEQAVLHSGGEDALRSYREGKANATLRADELAVLHAGGEGALRSYWEGKATGMLAGDESAVLHAGGEDALRNYWAGKANGALPADEQAVLHAAGEDALRNYQAGKTDARLTDHDRALLRAQKELEFRALYHDAFKGRPILAGSNLDPLHIADAVTDYALPGKATAKALLSGNFGDALVQSAPFLAPPDAKRGLVDAEIDMAKGLADQAKKSVFGPIGTIVERGGALINGDLAGAVPEAAALVEAPVALYNGLQKIADGDLRGGVREAAPAVFTLAPIIEPLAMHPIAPRPPTPQGGAAKGRLASAEPQPAPAKPAPKSDSFDPSKTRVVANASDGMGRNFQVVAPGRPDTPSVGPPRGPEGLSADVNGEPNLQTPAGNAEIAGKAGGDARTVTVSKGGAEPPPERSRREIDVKGRVAAGNRLDAATNSIRTEQNYQVVSKNKPYEVDMSKKVDLPPDIRQELQKIQKDNWDQRAEHLENLSKRPGLRPDQRAWLQELEKKAKAESGAEALDASKRAAEVSKSDALLAQEALRKASATMNDILSRRGENFKNKTTNTPYDQIMGPQRWNELKTQRAATNTAEKAPPLQLDPDHYYPTSRIAQSKAAKEWAEVYSKASPSERVEMEEALKDIGDDAENLFSMEREANQRWKNDRMWSEIHPTEGPEAGYTPEEIIEHQRHEQRIVKTIDDKILAIAKNYRH